MNLLVLNTGSSSVKFALFKNNSKNKIDSGKIERVKDYPQAISEILGILKQKNLEFDKIAHRVVHGGPLNKPSLINPKTEKIIKTYSEFAPLHNPLALKVIQECKKLHKPQYAVFDTAFFSDLPEKVKIYPIPAKITEKFNIKRYGFHGLSHRYISQNLVGKTITLHLGSGCSIAAIKDNKPLDISMGLTPLEGLMMGTRAGSIDPGLVIFLQKKGYNINQILNFESGFKGMTGFSDFREVVKNLDNKKVKLAYDIFVYQILKHIGSYIAVLNGLDNLVFSGEIGYNSDILRRDIIKNLKFLKSKFKIYRLLTDEESEIAKEVFAFI